MHILLWTYAVPNEHGHVTPPRLSRPNIMFYKVKLREFTLSHLLNILGKNLSIFSPSLTLRDQGKCFIYSSSLNHHQGNETHLNRSLGFKSKVFLLVNLSKELPGLYKQGMKYSSNLWHVLWWKLKGRWSEAVCPSFAICLRWWRAILCKGSIG